MLDLPRMERIRLTARPRVQRVVGWSLLAPNYELPPRVRIDLEHIDRLPDYPVVFAMNHTDRYNYWPFQYKLWRQLSRFTATWVKGKYYQSSFVGKFMELTNNIPTVSRGYLISRDFLNTMERPPSDEEYQTLRAMVNGEQADASHVPQEILQKPRDMLGRPFDPSKEAYATAVDQLFRAMMRRFVELNAEAFDKGLDVLVFPQGTRSIRLSRGHGGLAQIALKFRRTIVPVGCSGSDVCYPGGSPVARRGHIVYRLGQPISYEEMAPFHPPRDFAPFTPEAEEEHRECFQGLVDLVMDRINGLVDEPYKYGDASSSDGVRGTARFV